MADTAASRAALLALRRDRRVIEEGHRFLDERRVALAHELLRRARVYDAHRAAFLRRAGDARRTLGAAVGRHGFEGLQVHLPVALEASRLRRRESEFLGLRLVDAVTVDLHAAGTDGAAVATWTTADAQRCAAAWRELAQDAAALAGEVASLLRLEREYRRAERRVRALENIVLPAARADERRVEAALEELDQEEVMRARRFAIARGS